MTKEKHPDKNRSLLQSNRNENVNWLLIFTILMVLVIVGGILLRLITNTDAYKMGVQVLIG